MSTLYPSTLELALFPKGRCLLVYAFKNFSLDRRDTVTAINGGIDLYTYYNAFSTGIRKSFTLTVISVLHTHIHSIVERRQRHPFTVIFLKRYAIFLRLATGVRNYSYLC